MTAAHLTPPQWAKLSRADRIDLLAYQRHKHQQRMSLLKEAIDKVPGEVGMLAQILIEVMD